MSNTSHIILLARLVSEGSENELVTEDKAILMIKILDAPDARRRGMRTGGVRTVR